MKKFFILFLFCFLTNKLFAQFLVFNTLSNCDSIKAIVLYKQDKNGFYRKTESVDIVSLRNNDILNKYAFDKKTNKLYVEIENGNCVITLDKNTGKTVQKSKLYPLLQGKNLDIAIESINRKLADKFEHLNKIRQAFIKDSLEQARLDSIQRHIDDSIRIENNKKMEENYKLTNKWSLVPIPKKGVLKCLICDEPIKSDPIVYKISNDSIYWSNETFSHLGVTYRELHVGIKPSSYDDDPSYNYHVRIFKDSLETKFHDLNIDIIKALNSRAFLEYVNELKKEAPNGFFQDWGWDEDYTNVSFNFKYMNTNSKTIKYIDVYWAIYNAVGDVRKTGHFKGTGPLEFLESASWDWDHSSYYVSGDASKMNITKVIITYMDGTVVTIPKNKLRFD